MSGINYADAIDYITVSGIFSLPYLGGLLTWGLN